MSSVPGHGLLVDDDELFLRTLQRSLQRRGCSVDTAHDREQALRAARLRPPDFALLDLKLGADSGVRLIAPLRAIRADMRILLLTGYASVATAVEAIKSGADDYLLKPVSVDLILRALAGADEPSDAQAAAVTMLPLNRLEWEHIQQALNETQGNISAAARLLGMHRRTLQRKLAKRPGRERAASDS